MNEDENDNFEEDINVTKKNGGDSVGNITGEFTIYDKIYCVGMLGVEVDRRNRTAIVYYHDRVYNSH